MRHRTIILVNIIYFDCIITTIIAMVYYNYQISHPHSSSDIGHAIVCIYVRVEIRHIVYLRYDVRLDSSRDLKWLRTFVNEWTSIDDAYKVVQSYRLCYHRVWSVHHRCIAIVRAVRDLHISQAFQCLIRNSKTKAYNFSFIKLRTSYFLV
jgi:hypothetical protein